MFIDESGLLLAPVVRRSWSPRGQTPILYQRGRARDKVSIIAALTLSPRRRHTGLYFSLRAHENVTTAWLVPFLRALARHLRGPFILVWDRLTGHRARVVTAYLHRRHRAVALLPPYAPELNPVEPVWSNLKRSLANLVKQDIDQLTTLVKTRLRRMQYQPGLLDGFLAKTRLDLTPLQ